MPAHPAALLVFVQAALAFARLEVLLRAPAASARRRDFGQWIRRQLRRDDLLDWPRTQAVRGSADQGVPPLCMLTRFAVEAGVTLAQQPVALSKGK